MKDIIKVGLAQFSPIWLNKGQTIEKIISIVEDASKEDCKLLVFGEAYLPGYPFWLAHSGGAEFESKLQKDLFSYYANQAVNIENGDLNEICKLAGEKQMAIYLGIVERATDRGGHSLYCSLIYINSSGEIDSVHRKLQPTFEERLVWSPGDGHGLSTHKLGAFTVGGLNCWENWMPLARSALYAQGENLHVAVWPGSCTNTTEITRFIAKESRSYVLSVSSLLKKEDIPKDLPGYEQWIENMPSILADGGSCIADPAGRWVEMPVLTKEGLITAEIDLNMVYRERQNFDPSGHYSRPDVTQLILNRQRQSILKEQDLLSEIPSTNKRNE